MSQPLLPMELLKYWQEGYEACVERASWRAHTALFGWGGKLAAIVC